MYWPAIARSIPTEISLLFIIRLFKEIKRKKKRKELYSTGSCILVGSSSPGYNSFSELNVPHHSRSDLTLTGPDVLVSL